MQPKTQQASEAALVREWAAANGIELATRGRIPTQVYEQYRAAQRKPRAVKAAAKTPAKTPAEPAFKAAPKKTTPRKSAARKR